jgi:hypothetical protein
MTVRCCHTIFYSIRPGVESKMFPVIFAITVFCFALGKSKDFDRKERKGFAKDAEKANLRHYPRGRSWKWPCSG